VSAAVFAAAPPGASGPWLVVAPPWRDTDTLVHAAGGFAAGSMTAPLARLVTSDLPWFPDRASAIGLLVIDARSVSFICGDA
jgi:hypothetical protein